MAQQAPQTRRNHVRFDPMFHYFLAPASIAVMVWAVIHLIRHPSTGAGILACVAFLLPILALKARLYALRVQDRIIRLEERLRLAGLAPEAARTAGPALSEAQWIALRFASDVELPALAERAAREKLNNKQIKEAIGEWRPDYWRV